MTRVVGAVWADFTGRSRLTIIRAGTNPCGILTATQAISNAQVLWNWDGSIDPSIGSASSAIYEGVKQWAVLEFQTAAGNLIRLTVPAPQLGIFKADRQTVDPTAIGGLITACVGQLADQSGNLAVSYVGGVLMPDRSDLTPIGL